MKNRRLTLLLAIGALFAFAIPKISATTYRVGSAWTTGTSSNYYPTLQEFRTAVASIAATDEIWLSAGTHELTSPWILTGYQGKLYGGFQGTETSVAAREKIAGGYSWEFAHPTVFKLTAGQAANSAILASFSYSGALPILSEINGITFDAVNCTSAALFLRQFQGASITIKNCIVENGNPPKNNTLSGGTADYESAGINIGSDDATSTGDVTIDGCLIQNNQGRRGGGILARKATIRNSIIRNNTATESGGGIFIRSTSTLTNCIVEGNSTTGNGGGIENGAAGASIRNTTLVNNITGANGGALYLGADASVYNSIFWNNKKGTALNQINANGKSLTFNNNIIDVLPTGTTASDNILSTDVSEIFNTTTWLPVENFIGLDKGTSSIEGVTATDLAGNVRVINMIDIGPYEVQYNYTPPLPPHYDPRLVSTADIDWREFISQHDMYWSEIPADASTTGAGYYGGAIMGNGLLGTNLYKISTGTYRLNVGRTDVTEGRGQMPLYKSESHLYTEARLPIGYFQLRTKGTTVSKEAMRLSLYDAITKGQLTTNKGVIDFKTYVHSDKNYIIFESDATNEEVDYTWLFTAQEAISPRSKSVSNSDYNSQTNYKANPNPAVKSQTDGDYNLRIQNLVCGKTYVVAWKEVKRGSQRRIIATVSQENSEAQAIVVAKLTIDEGFATEQEALETTHTAWWHNYYPASFISLGSTKMESFYWAQIYKFACASRPNKPVVDIQGPWSVPETPWTTIWLNLNTQLTYSWQYAANRSDMTLPLWQAFRNNRENLIKNVTEIAGQTAWTDAMVMSRSSGYDFYRPLNPSLVSSNQYEVGNLTWLLYYYWQYCVYNNKQDELKTEFFNFLKYAVNYYVHIRTKSGDTYHLPQTSSPEYGASPTDCNYDLSVLRWGLQTLLAIDNKYNLNDANKAVYQDFLDHLVDYPVDATRGFNLGKDKPFTATHRHYSHLLMIYPLYTVNWEQPENQEVITKSVNNWQSLTGQLQGYSFTGSSAMYSSMGNGDLALTRLNSLLGSYIQKNTLYKETGPVFETPMAAVSSIHDLYLQSWGDKIRVFPAVPTTWQNASFIDLRTEGAYLVSATRNNGQTVFIQVKSEAGGLCRLQTGIVAARIHAQTLDGQALPFTVVDADKGLIEINTQAGDVFQIIDSAIEVKLPAPLAHPAGETNPYGVNKGGPAPVISGPTPMPTALSPVDPNDAANDSVVSEQYYNLMGQFVRPTTGVYIIQKIHASGKKTVEKELVFNK